MIPSILIEYILWLTIKSNVKDSVFLKFCYQRKLLLQYKITKKAASCELFAWSSYSMRSGSWKEHDMLSSLKTTFSEKSNPLYVFKDISSEDLDEERKIERFKKYISSKGSSKFQVTAWTTQENEGFNTTLHLQRLPVTPWFLRSI